MYGISRSALAILSALTLSMPAMADDSAPVMPKGGTVFCARAQETGFRCGDGTHADGTGGLIVDGAPFDPHRNATQEVILTVTAKVAHKECGGGYRSIQCAPNIYPETDYLTAKSLDDCRTLGRTIAYRKWETLTAAGHEASISWKCD